MAFDVTPTSGAGPYTFTAVFDDPTFIDGVNYSISVRSSGAVGSCPQRGSAEPFPPADIATLLNTGSVTVTFVIPAGSCRTFTLDVLRVSNNTSVANSSVSVNNVE